MSEKSLISVILPVYNASNYLKESIDSILNQTYTNFELIIINDGSTDESVEIIDQYLDSRIRIIHNETNLGLIATLNKGIDAAKGEFIARMDADDISLPLRFQKQIEFLYKNSSIDIVGSSYEIFGDENKIINLTTNSKQIEIELLFHNPICHPSVMWRVKSIIDTHMRFETNFIHNEDWAFWLTALEKGLKIANIPDVLLKYRFEGQNITVKNKHTTKERFINLYSYYLKPYYKIDTFELHWSISHAQPQSYSIKELTNQFKLIESSLYKKKYNKVLIQNILSIKRIKLFYILTDKSVYKGLSFLIRNNLYKWNYIYYLLTKIIK